MLAIGILSSIAPNPAPQLERTHHPTISMLRILALLLALVLVSLACTAERATEATLPSSSTSILWITIDTIRADHLGAYGYFRNTSPRFDALAEESLLFERSLAPIATTLPSHLSVLTATYPNEHGVLSNIAAGGKIFTPSEKLVSLAGFLAERNYATAAFVSATPLKDWSGIQRGFIDYDSPSARTRAGNETTDRALAWLKQHAGNPFFLWVHLFEPHHPHDTPPGIEAFHFDYRLDGYIAARHFPDSLMTRHDVYVDTRVEMNAYDAEILFADQQLGRLIDAVRHSDSADNVAIVVMGDHGEGMAQHGMPYHGAVWDEQLHVPLLMHVPGEPAQRVSQPMSIVDVFPTLLGRIDIPDEAQYLIEVSGIDVFDVPDEARAVFSQSSMRLTKWGMPLTYSLTSKDWKYTSASDGEQRLYDLREDPFELEDISDSRPDEVARFQAIIDERVALQLARNAEIGGTQFEQIDEALLEDLRALGYVDED